MYRRLPKKWVRIKVMFILDLSIMSRTIGSAQVFKISRRKTCQIPPKLCYFFSVPELKYSPVLFYFLIQLK